MILRRKVALENVDHVHSVHHAQERREVVVDLRLAPMVDPIVCGVRRASHVEVELEIGLGGVLREVELHASGVVRQ